MTDFLSLLKTKGFAFLSSPEMRDLLKSSGSVADFEIFSKSWDDLKTDTYMADKGRYRKRRHAVFSAEANKPIKREAHQPHYQSLDYNNLNGGIERWFEPVLPLHGESKSLSTILSFCRNLFEECAAAKPSWHIETHQFRIEARASSEGHPTPEGMHRDGVDYVAVILIRRENIASGVTTIHDLTKMLVGNFTLTNPFDAALVDDRKVYHGVTAVTSLDPLLPAYRDVLVVTFRAK